MEISLENLYVDIGTLTVKSSFSIVYKAYLNRSFEAVQFLASRRRFWKLSDFVRFPLLEFFVENSNRMQVLHQSYQVIFLIRQPIRAREIMQLL